MKILLIVVILFLIATVYKDLAYKIRYKDDPDTKTEWFDKGYKSGVKAGTVQGFLEALSEVKK